MAETASETHDEAEPESPRRDFLLISTIAVGAAGAAVAAWPFIHMMNPSRDVLALANTEIDLSPIEEGQAITVIWRGKPIFIRKRTAKEIETAKADDVADMKDPETDADRVQKPEWLVMIGICTHLGCIPLGQKGSDPKGEFDGWFC
ncbi:MAG: ubiquinol-cytochrome c reductase iron-sulfur subunit, partial [Pseudomonadota bacterium]|nr:ubiquinol-cytochrome c reductase iron-sulfur subunit [Pseudomonadota bacterium]